MIESARLKRLLELTRRVERARKGELMAARAELSSAEAALSAAQSAEAARVYELENGGDTQLSELELRAGLVDHARGCVALSDEARRERERDVATREDQRLHATRDVRKLEILWERDRTEYKRAEKEREQRFVDDTRRPSGNKRRGP